MDIRVTDRFTGEFTICKAEELAATMTVYGMTAEEIQTWKDAQAAILDHDWYALPVMAEILQADIETL